MSVDLFLALAGFALVTSITPGPNNMMLLASGVNFGFRRTIPHMLGINIGFMVMLALIGLGAGQVLEANPAVFRVLRIASLLYMLWLAWKIATSGVAGGGAQTRSGRPMTSLEAALFQWINPKAWAIAVPATTAYTVPENFLVSLAALVGVFAAVCLPSVGVWTAFGVGFRKVLRDPDKVRVFNITMAVLLVLSILPAIIDIMPRHG